MCAVLAWCSGLSANGCRHFKVYILDIDSFLQPAGHPTCIPEDRVLVDSRNGIVYTQEGAHKPGNESWQENVHTHHSFGTHAGPWHLAEVFGALARDSCVPWHPDRHIQS